MNITIIGCGNIGSLMAAEMAYRGHNIIVFTSKPKQWRSSIEVYASDEKLVYMGNGIEFTNDIERAVKNADIVWITHPAQQFIELNKQLREVVSVGQLIGVVPGSGGAEFAFSDLINKGCVLFGLQRVHSIARIKECGCSVYMLGRKKNLQIGAIPASASERISKVCEALFDMPCEALPNYLSVTLTPSNPILHTSRLYSMFKDYHEGLAYDRNFLFYKEWTNNASETMIRCDTELQHLCATIPMPLESVLSLREYYESNTAEAMTKKLSSIPAFKGITSPMRQTDAGWIPDLSSRYFSTDFPFGLKVIKDIAAVFDVKTPNMDILWDWYSELDKEHANAVDTLNISRDEFICLYKI